MSKQVVFIHGMFLNPASWAGWVRFFESRGYTCHTPAFPFHDGVPATLRQTIPEGLRTLDFQGVVHSLATFVSSLPEKPFLVGHSMGGLVVQKLLEQGLARAAVAIDSAPPQGIFSTKWSFLRANLGTINPLKGSDPCLPTVAWFQYAFCNTMSLEETAVEYEKFVVPESRNIPRSSTGSQGTIDFTKPHAPLLMIAGEIDHIIPRSLNETNFKAYRDETSVREFQVFAGRTHYLCNQHGWEEIAAFTADWLADKP